MEEINLEFSAWMGPFRGEANSNAKLRNKTFENGQFSMLINPGRAERRGKARPACHPSPGMGETHHGRSARSMPSWDNDDLDESLDVTAIWWNDTLNDSGDSRISDNLLYPQTVNSPRAARNSTTDSALEDFALCFPSTPMDRRSGLDPLGFAAASTMGTTTPASSGITYCSSSPLEFNYGPPAIDAVSPFELDWQVNPGLLTPESVFLASASPAEPDSTYWTARPLDFALGNSDIDAISQFGPNHHGNLDPLGTEPLPITGTTASASFDSAHWTSSPSRLNLASPEIDTTPQFAVGCQSNLNPLGPGRSFMTGATSPASQHGSNWTSPATEFNFNSPPMSNSSRFEFSSPAGFEFCSPATDTMSQFYLAHHGDSIYMADGLRIEAAITASTENAHQSPSQAAATPPQLTMENCPPGMPTRERRKIVRPVKCPACGKGHSYKGDLGRHIAVHHQDIAAEHGVSTEPRVCKWCGRTYTRPDRLTRHLIRRHGRPKGRTKRG